MALQNPPHPGQSVKLDCLEPLGLTVDKALQRADAIDVQRIMRPTMAGV